MAMNTANWLAGILLARQPLGLREFGLFNAAGRLQSVLLFLPSRIFQVTVPVLANLQAEGNRRGFIKALAGVATLTVLVTGFFAGIFLLFPDQLMSLFGREFAKGSGVLRIIAVVCVASSAWTVATAGLWAARKANQMLILDGTRGLLLVGICLSGFVVNARSLAFAFLASYLVGLVLLSGVLFRFVRQPWPSEKLAYQNNSRGV